MIQQLLKQIALLSLLQTVFSKKSVDIIQHYFGNTKGAVQNQVGNTYRIRKQSLAFVQSRARYFNAKSDQIFSVVSSASISTKRKFSLSFGHLGQETVKEIEKRNAAEATGIKIVKIQDKENISPNEMSNRASWAKRTLFQDFDSVQGIAPTDFHHVSKQGAIHAKLASIVYEDSVPNVHSLGHSIVARGTTADVKWMVTDSVGHDHDFQATSSGQSSDPTIIRTITIRGFDASDEEVDRGRLVTDLCNAGKVTISDDFPNLKVHRGLLSIAKRIYEDVKTFIDLAGPAQKIVLTGHSIGGALANLVLMLMTVERGNVFVREKVKRVFTFGSPPIAKVDIDTENSEEDSDMYGCSVLNTLGLPSDIVYGYVGPWDPIVRLFSPIDTLEPLIGDLGDDGVTIYASGPPRTLRLVIRALLETWEDWPTFRDNNRYVMKQDYTSIGVQHILMSDRGRFLSDRLLAVDINAFPVDDVLRVSSKELYGVLEEVFPLNVFSISVVPTAIRSFVHHFVPAYADGFDMYIKKKQNNSKKSAPVAVEPPKQTSSSHNILNQQFEVFNELSSRTIGFDFADHATTWVLGGV